jgi:hypothetical protein
VQTTAANQTRKRTKPRAPIEASSWLILDLDGIKVFTSAAVLRRNGLPIASIAAFLQKKFKLNNPKKARPDKAFNALRALILKEDAIIHPEGHV